MVAFFANYGVVGTAADRVFAAKLRVGNCTRCALRRDVRIGIHCQAQTMVVDGYDIRSDGSNHYLLWCTGHYGWTAAPALVFRCVFSCFKSFFVLNLKYTYFKGAHYEEN